MLFRSSQCAPTCRPRSLDSPFRCPLLTASRLHVSVHLPRCSLLSTRHLAHPACPLLSTARPTPPRSARLCSLQHILLRAPPPINPRPRAPSHDPRRAQSAQLSAGAPSSLPPAVSRTWSAHARCLATGRDSRVGRRMRQPPAFRTQAQSGKNGSWCWTGFRRTEAVLTVGPCEWCRAQATSRLQRRERVSSAPDSVGTSAAGSSSSVVSGAAPFGGAGEAGTLPRTLDGKPAEALGIQGCQIKFGVRS